DQRRARDEAGALLGDADLGDEHLPGGALALRAGLLLAGLAGLGLLSALQGAAAPLRDRADPHPGGVLDHLRCVDHRARPLHAALSPCGLHALSAPASLLVFT